MPLVAMLADHVSTPDRMERGEVGCVRTQSRPSSEYDTRPEMRWQQQSEDKSDIHRLLP